MGYDLDWLDNLSPETIQAIKNDLNRNPAPAIQTEGPTVLLADGRRVPGEYHELRKALPDRGQHLKAAQGNGDFDFVGTRQEIRVPLYDNDNQCIIHVPENTVEFHLGGFIGSPPKGAYTRIIKEND